MHGVRFCKGLVVCTVLSLPVSIFAQSGHVVNGVGPVNQAMAGAGTANPLDASGAMHLNPASISGLPASSVDLGLELLIPTIDLSSSVSAPVAMSGSTHSEFAVFPIPSLSAVFRDAESPWTFGAAAYGVCGFGVDYPTSTTNPILLPQAMGGFGHVFSKYCVFQVYPTVAYELIEGLSVGFAPTLNLASLTVDPFPAVSPGPAGYPDSSNEWAVGGGFQAGVYYRAKAGWHVGASIKSPQWFDSFDFTGSGGEQFSFNLDFPMIISAGVGYSGFDRLELAADFRYIDYENTDGFDASGFTATGSVRGFGWKSIYVLAIGAQYRVSDNFTVQMGYGFNTNPISDRMAFFNVAAPAIIQHHLAIGFSYRMTDALTVSLGYTHGFENSVAGPIFHPAMGEVPGTQVESRMSTDCILIGFSWAFDGSQPSTPE